MSQLPTLLESCPLWKLDGGSYPEVRGLCSHSFVMNFAVMKFGKRLLAEAERRWLDHYLDYKALKHAIQADVEARGKR